MNKIMVDNWFMEEVLTGMRDNRISPSQSYADLLMAIVLWDEVYYPQNDYTGWNSLPSQVQNVLSPIDDNSEDGFYESLRQLYRYNSSSEEECLWHLWKNEFHSESEIIGGGALRYVMLSNKNECDYLPCEKRREFLNKLSNQQDFKRALFRMKMQGTLNNTIADYYSETYNALLDFPSLNLQMPVLVNFIFDNTPKEMTPIEYALHLKNEGFVIKYRQYLDQVENALEEQRWEELRFLLNCSKDAVSDVISMDKNNIGSVEVKLLPTPSISLKFEEIRTSISSATSFTINKKINRASRRIHLTFLKELTKYAINDMKLW